MNMCDECGINPANIHLTQILQNETHVFHLCDELPVKRELTSPFRRNLFQKKVI